MNQKLLWPALTIIYFSAVCLSLFLPSVGTMSFPLGFDKLVHFGEFFLLAILALKNTELFFPKHKLLAYLLLFALAFSTELIQLRIQSRSFSWFDFIMDSFGITIGMITYLIISWKL
jgi:VanZ family protein